MAVPGHAIAAFLRDVSPVRLAIVGVTEQFVFERVDMDKYTNYVLELQRDVARFNINQANQEDVDPNRMYDDHDDDDWKQTVPLGRITFVPRE